MQPLISKDEEEKVAESFDPLAIDDSLLADDEDDINQNIKFLTFRKGEESYGIHISSVIEIIEFQKIIVLPNMPDFIKGVINLRGRIIPVMDIRKRFNFAEREYDDRTCIIIVKIADSTMGLIVDTVEEVVEILPDDIEPAPKFKKAGKISSDYISGIGHVSDEIKILLDVGKILFQEEIDAISAMEQSEDIEKDVVENEAETEAETETDENTLQENKKEDKDVT